MNFKDHKLTAEQRPALAAVAQMLAQIWLDLPTCEDEEKGGINEWKYRGGLFHLVFKGGFCGGWADLDWNRVIADIYQGRQFSPLTYEQLEEQLKKDAEAEETTSSTFESKITNERQAELTKQIFESGQELDN